MAMGLRGVWERLDGGDGDFTVEIVVEISSGIVLRSWLWMAVGPIGAWEIRRWRWRGEGGGTCCYVGVCIMVVLGCDSGGAGV